MTTETTNPNAPSGPLARAGSLILPAAVAAMVLVILVPLPAGVVNVLLVGDIALAAVVLLMTLLVRQPQEFSAFPSVLLAATLGRLVVALAAVRLILTCGADGAGVEAAPAAVGGVLWAFGQWVTSGSLAVGVILFTILAIVQFVVVTKGAARISEVAARFMLDAMPGKQMAVDADLAASAITPEQARHRRDAIAREADFYGTMDGASKFLRGDAIAAVLILGVSLLGGLYVGLVRYHWPLGATVSLFVRLTIGAGLAMQIPALLVAVATALIVSRSGGETDLGSQVVHQLTARPVALLMTAAMLGVLMFTGLPKLPVGLLAVGCLGLALLLRRIEVAGEQPAAAGETAPPPAPATGPPVQHVRDLLAVETMRLELGFALVGLVEAEGHRGLLQRVAALRRRIAAELGLVVPPIRIRDNMEMDSRGYAIYIRGAKVASGRLYPKEVLAVGPEDGAAALPGRVTTEPGSGAWAVWIAPSRRAQAEAMGYTVVDGAEVLLTHLDATVRDHAAELLTRQQTAELLANLQTTAPHLVEEVTGKLTTAQIQKVLANLLRERVSIRDLEAILEYLCDAASHTSETAALTEQVRAAMGRSLCQPFCDHAGKLPCVDLSPALAEELGRYVSETPTAGVGSVPPDVGQAVAQAATASLEALRRQGRRAVLVCPPRIRPVLRQIVAPALPEAVVLGYNEIGSVEVESVASLEIHETA